MRRDQAECLETCSGLCRRSGEAILPDDFVDRDRDSCNLEVVYPPFRRQYRPVVSIFGEVRSVRMYLSSYRLGDHVDRLFDLMRGERRVGIIANALDFIPDNARQRYEETVYSPLRELSNLGAEPEYLDLRRYFGNPNALKQALREIDLVWVLGGNVFLLRRAMRQSGFDDLISRLLEEDSIVYGGFSAGAVVATRTLKGIDLMDDPHQLAFGYDQDVIWDGLGLLDFSIVPHYRSDHDEAEMAERAVAFFEERTLPFQAIRDGDAILIEDGVVSLLSNQSD